jgi:ornithine carbamoyltransferase
MVQNSNTAPGSSKKNVVTLLDYTTEEIRHIIHDGKILKRNRLTTENNVLRNKTGVLIFEKPSLRTHISFDTALHELGGHPIVLSSNMVQMGKRESVRDVAKNLERLVHLIIARTHQHQTIEELAKYSSIPVINALSDKFHPCQAMAFAMTVSEHVGDSKDINVVFIGDGNNVCNSLMVVCAQLGYNFTAASPKGYEPDRTITETCSAIAKTNGGSITITNNPYSCLGNATVMYTDVWASMGQETEAEYRKTHFAGYQINSDMISKAPSGVLVSHCLPAHRGEEITSDVLDSEHSIALDEAENRLHIQKAIIVHLFS